MAPYSKNQKSIYKLQCNVKQMEFWRFSPTIPMHARGMVIRFPPRTNTWLARKWCTWKYTRVSEWAPTCASIIRTYTHTHLKHGKWNNTTQNTAWKISSPGKQNKPRDHPSGAKRLAKYKPFPHPPTPTPTPTPPHSTGTATTFSTPQTYPEKGASITLRGNRFAT